MTLDERLSDSNTDEKNNSSIDRRKLTLLHGPISPVFGYMAAANIFLVFTWALGGFAETGACPGIRSGPSNGVINIRGEDIHFGDRLLLPESCTHLTF